MITTEDGRKDFSDTFTTFYVCMLIGRKCRIRLYIPGERKEEEKSHAYENQKYFLWAIEGVQGDFQVHGTNVINGRR